jgi:vacuolar-type H+-ATPase subunit C/Vma6
MKDWHRLLFSHDPYQALRETRYAASITPQTRGAVWKSLLREHLWVFLQMDRGLREVFQPYFVYAELKTLLTCLRYKTQSGSTAEIEQLLALSLLSDNVKNMMTTVRDLPLLLETLGKNFLLPAPSSASLARLFVKEGLAGVEQRITMITFTWIMSLDLHPAMKGFFTLTADLKNIITAWKHLRWSIASEPVLLEWGRIRKSVLLKIIRSREISEMVKFIHRYTGESPHEPALYHIERVLLSGMTKQTRTLARAFPDIGPVLDYLWRCYLETLNIGMVLYGQEIDRAVIQNELIAS